MKIQKAVIISIILVILIISIIYSTKSISLSPSKQKTPIEKYLNTLSKESGYTQGSLTDKVEQIANKGGADG